MRFAQLCPVSTNSLSLVGVFTLGHQSCTVVSNRSILPARIHSTPRALTFLKLVAIRKRVKCGRPSVSQSVDHGGYIDQYRSHTVSINARYDNCPTCEPTDYYSALVYRSFYFMYSLSKSLCVHSIICKKTSRRVTRTTKHLLLKKIHDIYISHHSVLLT